MIVYRETDAVEIALSSLRADVGTFISNVDQLFSTLEQVLCDEGVAEVARIARDARLLALRVNAFHRFAEARRLRVSGRTELARLRARLNEATWYYTRFA